MRRSRPEYQTGIMALNIKNEEAERLAAEVARQVAGRFADGVWLAELAAVRDPAQVAPARSQSR